MSPSLELETLLPDRFGPATPVGQGAFGTVFRTVDRELGREVAVKTLNARNPARWPALKREFRQLADLVHPNLAELYELFVLDDCAFFTMEFVPGQDLIADLREGCARGQPPREERWSARVRQLAEGIGALHAEGIVHRDLKPSNVRVRPDGVLKVLDYGFALRTGPFETGERPGGRVTGTPAYLPPEAFVGATPTAAFDWYALGVTLYHALTGRLPFPPGLHAAILAKRRVPAGDPDERIPGLPPGASRLALDLMHPDPECRPDLAEVRRRLSGGDPTGADSRDSPDPVAVFIGRSPELGALRGAWGEVLRGAARVVLVHGPSGVGKTGLVERFVAGLGSEGVALRSRCLPNESVHFKALDGAVDEIARRMRARDPAALAGSPAIGPALKRVFPSLSGLGTSGDITPDPPDPTELRRRAVRELRGVLHAVSAAVPVLLWIDDAQWGDRDSALVLRELLRDAELPRILVLCTFRADEREASPYLRALDEAGWGGPLTSPCEISLGPLDLAEAQSLARAWLRARGEDGEVASAAVARGAGGIPFFIEALCRHVLDGGNPTGDPRPEQIVLDRLGRLPPDAGRMLEVVAVAGGPTPREVLVAASGLGPTARNLLGSLAKARLVRGRTAGDAGPVTTYHDRIREGVVATLHPDRLVETHLALAEAWERSADSDPDVLLGHLVRAGARERAAPLAFRAAERAAASLAFGRAAELFGLAFDLGLRDIPDWDLLGLRAEALVNDGRGPAAAEVYREAARRARDGGAPGAVLLDLRRRAAEQFYRTGRGHEGRGILEDALRAVGVRLPRTPGQALFRAAWGRLVLVARGLRIREGARGPFDPRDLGKLDAVWVACGMLSMTHPDVADAMNLLHLRLALRVGEPTRLVRTLGMESNFEAAVGGPFLRRRSKRVLEQMASLAERCGTAYERAWVEVAGLTNAWFEGRWARAVDGAERALALYRAETRGTEYERAVTTSFLISALAHQGRLRRLREWVPVLIAEAVERGDLFAATSFLDADGSLAWLAAADPDALGAEIAAARARWPLEDFSVPHYHQAVAEVHLLLYLGDEEAAWRRLEEAWPALRRRLFLRLELIGLKLRYLRARVAVAVAARRPPGERRPWLREAAAEARRIGRSRLPVAAPFVTTLRASVAAVQGDLPAASSGLAAAERGFAGQDMGLHAAAVAWARARIGGSGDRGGVPPEVASWLEGEGVVDPERLLRAVVPRPLLDCM